MSQKLKVVTIGGGSSYTPELLEGFIKRYHELPVTELWLVDVEDGKEKLGIIYDLCQRMIDKAGVPLKLYKTLDRREALKGANFVTTQLRVGQLKARELDERIPLSHGYLGQETNGAGGLFKGLRTIPVIFDIIKDVEELCPNAWVINFTNPAGMVTEAVYRHTNFKKFIGVCNIPVGMKMFIHDVLALNENDDLSIDLFGLNHMVFIKDVLVNGTSRFAELLDGATPHPRITRFDEKVLGLIHTIKGFEVAASNAALSGNFNDVLLALNLSPLVHSDRDAEVLARELILAHEKWLPNFAACIEALKGKHH